ncbi:MAG: trypsin-like peptidase domain-containing protein [candidate division Zixibacteria bacterium]|nr:trypsin-like peptidase domain-containing protein [candidate division Zixibacteria bacterium]
MSTGMLGAGRRAFSSVLFALLFILVGIIIASMLDLPATPIAKERAEPLSAAQASNRPDDFSTPFINVVAMARDAVVNITAESENRGGGTLMNEYFRFFGLDHPRFQRSYGTGFIFRNEGYILTNNHVIANGGRITVTLSNNETYMGKLVGADPATDLAVLKIDPKGNLPVIPFGHSDELEVGEWVVAIGNPFPQQGLDRTVTAGVVSAKNRKNLRFAEGDVQYQNYIQTDASINPGNSGGPLLNLKGEVIGINAAISSPTGVSVGIGFAIPIDYARAVVPDLIAHGSVVRGWLGLSDIRDVSRDQLDEMHLSGPAVTFDKILRGSPAASAGLRPGDVIVKYDNKPVADASDFMFRVASTPINTSVPMDVLRDGRPLTLDVTIGDRAKAMETVAERGQQQVPGSDDDFWLGMAVSECSPQLAYRLGVECPESGGVIVTDVLRGSPADNSNIIPGVVVMEIDKFEIRTLADYRAAAVKLKDKNKPISFIVLDTEGNMRWAAIDPRR